jgi:hypothetical protein
VAPYQRCRLGSVVTECQASRRRCSCFSPPYLRLSFPCASPNPYSVPFAAFSSTIRCAEWNHVEFGILPRVCVFATTRPACYLPRIDARPLLVEIEDTSPSFLSVSEEPSCLSVAWPFVFRMVRGVDWDHTLALDHLFIKVGVPQGISNRVTSQSNVLIKVL